MTRPQFDYHARAQAVLKAKQDYDAFMAGPMHRLRTNGLTPAVRHEWDALVKTSEYKRLLDAQSKATAAITTPQFWELFNRLRTRTDQEALENAIAFLEADPYFFRSGYLKQKMLRFIRGYQATPEQISRLQNVVLYIVDTHYCSEFRDYCRLAARIADDTLRHELQSRLQSKTTKPGVRNRAQWVLDCVEGRYTGSWTRR